MNIKNNSIKQFKGRAIDKNRRTIELIISQIAYSTDSKIFVRSLKMFLLIIHSEILYQIMNCKKKKRKKLNNTFYLCTRKISKIPCFSGKIGNRSMYRQVTGRKPRFNAN